MQKSGKMMFFLACNLCFVDFTDGAIALAAIFRSLLYEACGRIANPVHGSVGLLWSGDWQLCQAAVEAVLKGTPIARAPITNEAAVTSEGPPLKAYDIRHVSKDEKSAASNDLHRPKTSCKFKRSGTKYRPSRASRPQPRLASKAEPNRSTSHESSLSHQSELGANLEGDSKEVESMVSEERADPSQLFRAESESVPEKGEEVRGSTGIGLELTLGLEPVVKAPNVVPVKKRRFEEFRSTESESGGCASEMELGF